MPAAWHNSRARAWYRSALLAMTHVPPSPFSFIAHAQHAGREHLGILAKRFGGVQNVHGVALHPQHRLVGAVSNAKRPTPSWTLCHARWLGQRYSSRSGL